jgi:hypothetical protein
MFYNDLITLLTSLVNLGLWGMLWFIHNVYTESKLRGMRHVTRGVVNDMRRDLERRIERLEDELNIGTGVLIGKDETDSDVPS